MSKSTEKQYGLIIPNKNKTKIGGTAFKKPSIFESDSDSEDFVDRPTGISTGLKRQDKEIQNKAIEEDPTIYQYDELYDDMDQKRKESKLSRKDLDKKPKYISNLLKAAEKRKIENERRIERQVQREREAEGNEFQDKEQFVTASYKKKLEEMRQQEELDKREEYLESIGDVTKQVNLDGFYRHLYEQKVNFNEDKEKKMDEIKTTVKKETNSDNNDSKSSDNKVNSKEGGEKNLNENKSERSEEKGTKRQYRRKQRQSTSDESDEDANSLQNKNLSHLPSNLDADSDFSIDSDSDSDDNKDKSGDKGEPNAKKSKKELIESLDKNIACEVKKEAADEEKTGIKKDVVVEEVENEIKPSRINIWAKRTVGDVFDAALLRYLARKQARSAG